MPDIDIDFQTKFDPQHIFDNIIPASMIKNNDLVKHTCGHYFQNIAVDDITGLSAIPYEEAEVLGYEKIDFLHLSLLDNFKSKSELRRVLHQEPNWDLLLDPDCVSQLFQIHKNHSLLCQVRPRSIQELADCIALIRPGKRYLLESYIKNKDEVRKQLYTKPKEGYYFKKSHSIAYAMTIVLQLNQLSLN